GIKPNLQLDQVQDTPEPGARGAGQAQPVSSYRRGEWDRCVPLDVVAKQPRLRLNAGLALEHQGQQEIAQPAGDWSWSLVAAGFRARYHHTLHPLAAELLVGSKRLLQAGQVAQALGERDSVFNGHGRALAGAWLGGMGGVADDDHRPT